MFRLLITVLCSSLVLCGTLNKNYNRENFSHKAEGRIINGHSARMGQFQSIASLRRENVHVGAGALIHNNWVLTAASVTLAFNRPADLRVVLGVVNTGAVAAPGMSMIAQEIIRHQGFVLSNSHRVPQNNIALVRIAAVACNAARFGNISPIFMDPQIIVHVAGSVVAGWGSTQFLSFSRAVEFGDPCDGPTGIQLDALCAHATICHGDVGGPLISGSGLIGIASSTPCDASSTIMPDVYMRISSYRMWILLVTGI